MSRDLLRAIEELPVPHVLVVGDLILDRYVSGSVDRVSPEAPIQVLRENGIRENPGGAAGVAANLARLGAAVRLVGVLGADPDAALVRDALAARGVETDDLVAEEGRPTTRKTRYVAWSQHARQQILRVDRETAGPLLEETRACMLQAVKNALPEVETCLLSDYGKGVLGPELCRDIVQAARHAGVPVVVDPKGPDFLKYRNATAITPNRAEAGAATGLQIRGEEDAAAAARQLLDRLELDAVYVTLDRDGIYVFERDGAGVLLPTEPREVYDVTGAGDNVLAVLGYALAGGTGAATAAALANVAGGLAVERFGAVSIGWDEIAARIAAQTGGDGKLLPLPVLERVLDNSRRAGRRIVFTNGCFDVLHAGHVDFLRRARALGDVLVVGLNDDASVSRLKGEGRPVHDLAARAAVLSGLSSVDFVVAYPEDTPDPLVRSVRPDVLVKGEDWREKGVVGREFVESYGGRVELLPLLPGHSTTSILKRMPEGG